MGTLVNEAQLEMNGINSTGVYASDTTASARPSATTSIESSFLIQSLLQRNSQSPDSDAQLRGSDQSNNNGDHPVAETLWKAAKLQLETSLDPQIFSAWILPLELTKCAIENSGVNGNSFSCAVAEIGCPNKFARDHVRQQYSALLANILADLTKSDNVVLRFNVKKPSIATAGLVGKSSPAIQESRNKSNLVDKNGSSNRQKFSRQKNFQSDFSNLNQKYRFDNFVVGSCNQFAHAVSLRVSENLGSNYNPLFLYGGVGLGKTHLANAIGNTSKAQGKKVLFVSSESFVNELIAALRANRMQSFKDRFRSLDLLVIDDIQFMIGKERTQEEFFHTFNALHNKRGQVVVTSDKIPQELTGLEERLKTRFSSGIAVDLQTPDFETRVAILMKKAEFDQFPISQDVAELLAEKIDSNVRELEGALNRLHAIASLNGGLLSIDVAEEALRSVIPERRREITIEVIQKVVAEKYSITIKDLLGKRRTQHVALPRHVAMYLCRKLTTCSYPEIGALFGGRDHSTVIHANKVICDRINTDPEVKGSLEFLERRLKG